MADCEWLKNEPHSFGECEERNLSVRVKSSAWKVEEQRATIIVRSEGDELKFHIPKILGVCKTGVEVNCSVEIYVTDYIDMDIEEEEELLAFTSSMMVYNEDLQTSIVVPAMAILKKNIGGETMLVFGPVKGPILNLNCFTARQEVNFGVMDTTITINKTLVVMQENLSDDIDMGEGDEPGEDVKPGEDVEPGGGDEPGEDVEPGGGDEPGEGVEPGGGDEPGGDVEPGGGVEPGGDVEPGGGDEPGGDVEPGGGVEPGGDVEPGGGVEPGEDNDDYEGDYIGFIPVSDEKINELVAIYEVPTSWNYKVIRCLANCKAWQDEEYPLYGLVGVNNLEAPTNGVIVFKDITHFIKYADTNEGSEIIIKENGVLAQFFQNIPNGILATPKVYAYNPKNYDSVINYSLCDGIFYYYDNSFRLTPNTETYKYFYPLLNRFIKQQFIGYDDDIFKVSFAISLNEGDKMQPEDYTNVRANVDTYLDTSVMHEEITAVVYKQFTMSSNVIANTITNSTKCERTATTGKITIHDLCTPIKRTDGIQKDVLKLGFDNDDFYDFYGGCLPSGTLGGTCKILYYDMIEDNTKEVDGTVYFHDGVLKIICDEEFSILKYWYSKSNCASAETPYIGITSMSIEFEIQKSLPVYVDLIEN